MKWHVGSLLHVKLLQIPFDRDVIADVDCLTLIHRRLSFSAETPAFLCTSREHRQSLQLKAQVQCTPNCHVVTNCSVVVIEAALHECLSA